MAQDRMEKLNREPARRDVELALAERRAARNQARGNQPRRSWGDVPAACLLELVAGVAVLSGSVLLGQTRDGGALMVRIYHDLYPMTEYIRPSDDCEAVFGDILLDLQDAVARLTRK